MTQISSEKQCLNLGKSALLIIDMQNDFLLESAPIQCYGALNIVGSIVILAKKFRDYNRPIIFTQEVHRKEKVDFGLELEYEEPEHCLEGSDGVEIFKGLHPGKGDFLITKRRYSAFFSTDLDLLLRGLGVDTLVLTGVATDVCVRATAQDAHQHNYKVIVPEECVAGTGLEAHQHALNNIAYVFGKIVSLQSLLQKIDSCNLK